MPHWVVSYPLSLGELQGPTSPAAGSLKQLRDAGYICTLRGSRWMRTMTGESLGSGLEIPTLGKLGGFRGEPGDTGWILCQRQREQQP